MAGKGRKIVVEFIGDDRSLSKTATQVEGKMGRLGGRFGKVALVAGGALVAGVGGAAVALAQMTKNAAEDEAGQRRLAVALKNTAGATKAQTDGVEKWISAQGKALGIADDQLRPAFQRLVQSTGDIGKAQKLAAIAMDASAGSGKSLEAVSTAIAKAQNGNMGALSRLGVKIKDANGETLSFNDAMKEMSKTFGGQAKAKANSFEGQMARLQLVFDETKEAIGARLIPIATKLAGWFLDKGLPAMERFGGYLSKTLGPVFAKVGGFFKKFGKDGEAGSSKFSGALAKIKPMLDSLVSIVKSVTSIISSLWKRFGGTITSLATSTFKNLVTVIGGALKVISGIFKVFASLLKGDWKGVWDGLKQIVSGAWAIIKGLVSQGWAVIKAAFSVGASVVKGVFVGLWNALKAAVSAGWNGIKALVSGMWTGIKSIFSASGSAVASVFSGIWNGLKDKASAGVETIRSAIAALPGKISALGSKMKDAGAELLNKLISGIGSAGSFAADFAAKMWNAIKRVINGGIDKLNGLFEFSYKLPRAIGGGSIGIDLPDIPHLYRGGIVPGSKWGTPIVAGDRGRAEAIVPLSGPHAPSGLGGTVVINVYGVLTEAEAGKKIEQVLTQRRRTSGRSLAFL